jgi:hypothetical protein
MRTICGNRLTYVWLRCCGETVGMFIGTTARVTAYTERLLANPEIKTREV